MSLKLLSFSVALILFIFLRGALSRGYYTIIAPATIRSDSVFHMSLTLNNFNKSCWFNISLTRQTDGIILSGLKSIEVKPGTTKLVELYAISPNVTLLANLQILGYRGIITNESKEIIFEPDTFWSFIQINKAQFKPGELVQFRIICIDQLTRPAKLKETTSVEIYDDQDNIIKNINDVKFVKGVFRSEFQISEYPVLGVWRIEVYIGDIRSAVKKFEVDRYVFPKFNVKIKTKNYSIYDDRMVFEISASYSDGEPVKGNLSFTMEHKSYELETLPKLTREFQINGKITIVLDLENDLQMKRESSAFASYLVMAYKFHIEAIVIDELSEEKSRAVIELGVYTKPFKIELYVPKDIYSDALLNIKVKVLIRDLDDNLIQDTKTPIEIIVQCKDNPYRKRADVFRNEYKNQIGKDFAIIEVINKNYTDCKFNAEYQGKLSYTEEMHITQRSLFDMDILTKSPQDGKELKINITYPDPIGEFSYAILSKGDIIQSDQVNVPQNQTTYILRLNVTFAMVPKITIYCHLIKDMAIIEQRKEVFIKRLFQNSIEVTTDNEAKPGSSIYINVTTDEGSYVGLMGLDRNALQNPQEKDILNDDYIKKNIRQTENIITFSNAISPTKNIDGSKGGKRFPEPLERIRKLFPESWLFKDFQSTSGRGFNILETTPDSITSWAITGFSINPQTGLTFTKNTTNLKVFQSFFISMDLPNTVIEDEIIEVSIYISNNINQDALTNVTIETDNENLGIIVNSLAKSKTKQNIHRVIPPNKRDKFLILLKTSKHGLYNVTVKANCSVASDAVQKILTVQRQGIPYAISKTYLVHLPEQGIQEDEITIDIPKKSVPGSVRVEVSIVGDIFRHLIKNMKELTGVPYGNGEENMRLIISNSIILKYIKALNYSVPTLEAKIRQNLVLGYQNQLPLKYLDGSFGLHVEKNRITGVIWQTILTLWGLKLANEFIFVDPKIFSRSLDYLKRNQQKNGRFKSESGLEEDIKFTAIGLMVFLMDEETRKEYEEVINKGLAYLYANIDDLKYSPITIMSIYVLLLGKHEKAEDLLKKLASNATLKSKQILWIKSDTLESHLEAIAGSLMNLFESQEIPEQSILLIVRGLIGSEKEKQSITHLIALQAMITFVKKLFSNRTTNLEINLKDDQNKFGNYQVNSDNSQVLQMFEVSRSSRKFNIQSKGHGFAVLNLGYNYNIVPENQFSSFYNINIITKKISKHLGVLKICSSIPAKNHQNKLTIMEVNLQSGFIFTEKVSQDVENLGEYIKLFQVNDSRHKFMIYFELRSNEACIELEVLQSYNVFNSKPGWVIVNSAHDKDQTTIKSIKFNGF